MASEIEPVEFGRYRLLRLLGRGGMAEVYLAESLGPMSFRKLVAIKRMLPVYAKNKRYVQMLLDEARISGGINHPNVVQVIDMGQFDGQHYIAMEYVDGIDLAGVLRTLRAQGRHMPLSIALHVARCIARGLHAAHALTDNDGRPMRVVHRDVSPHNVLISHEGYVKLIDFGVAKAETNLTMTRSGVIKGKLQYMSPEQAQAKAVDGRADIFSLGMTLYKMLVGHLPFTGTNEFQIYDEILHRAATPPSATRPDVTERVDALVLRALRKHADERFATGEDMARVIDRALSEIEPGIGAHDVAAWLSSEVPDDRRAGTEENDDFRAVEDRPRVAAAADWDAERIQRLTRVVSGERLIETLLHSVESSGRRAGVGQGEPGPTGEMAETARPTVVTAAVRGPFSIDDAAFDDGDATQAPAERPTEAMQTATPIPAAPVTAPPLPVVRPVPTESALRRRKAALLASLVGGAAALLLGLVVFFFLDAPPALGPAGEPVRLNLSVVGAHPTDAPTAPPIVVQAPPLVPLVPLPISMAPPRTAPPSPATATAPVASPPATEAPKPTAEPRAYLTVITLPWAWVYVDGQKFPRHTPIVGAPVKPGHHLLKLETGDGRVQMVDLSLRPGQRETVSHAFK